ncbi:hypothetical protein DN462_25090 [Citrobacter freundii]|uniref:hypothetical protein n=1 Tax=Citrobacter freundii TaxID=546 RepID=UPI000FE37BCB|nr:hypothetical protein [Citrobacter freundii]RWS84446.1 hypothetical protein DN462_25090 [Citrobacter freundii]
MIGLITKIIELGMGYFTKTKVIEKEVKVSNAEGQVEINKIEIEKSSIHWRNALGFVITAIVAYNWLIVPLLDAFGIVVIQVPLGELLTILQIMLGGV